MSTDARFVLLIDGRAGCGKTTLAEGLALTYDADVVHMDDLTPGWFGLREASEELVRMLESGRARRYDWVAKSRTDEIAIDSNRSLIVEGCGSLTPRSVALATHTLWIECDDELRRERAIGRDGEMFAQFWEEWSEQELEHLRVNQPQLLANSRYRSERSESEHDKLLECSKLLSLSQVVAQTSEHCSKPAPEAN